MFIVNIKGADSFIAADKEAISKGMEKEFDGGRIGITKSTHGYTVDWVAGNDNFVKWGVGDYIDSDAFITAEAVTAEVYQ
jgi:hypothetical protein